MALNRLLLLPCILLLTIVLADQYSIIRDHRGDIFTFNRCKDNWDFCDENEAIAIPWEKCRCQCLPSSPVFRQDLGKCVNTISECGNRMGVFVSSAFTEMIPLIALPENGEIIYPTAEISLIDHSLESVGPNLCFLVNLKLLNESGWQQMQQFEEKLSNSLEATGDDGKLFLRFKGDKSLKNELASGVAVVEASCEQESTKKLIKYCIVFRIANSVRDEPSESSSINCYVAIGLGVGLVAVVIFVIVTIVYLILSHKSRKKRKKVPFDDESHYDIIDDKGDNL